MSHLNNKQNKTQTQSSADRIIISLSFDHQKKNKQTKIQHKSYPMGSSHKPLDQTSEGKNKKEERIQPSSREEFNFPWSLGKGDLKHNNLKNKNNEKAEKYYTNERTN